LDSLSLLDLFIILIVLYFLISGYRRGFIRQTAAVIGIIISVYMAFRFYLDLTDILVQYIDLSPTVLQFISFSLIFIVFNVAIHLLSDSLRSLFRKAYLEPVDNAGGFIMGGIKGILIVYLLVLILNEIPLPEVEEIITNSYLAGRLLNLTPVFQDLLNDVLG